MPTFVFRECVDSVVALCVWYAFFFKGVGWLVGWLVGFFWGGRFHMNDTAHVLEMENAGAHCVDEREQRRKREKLVGRHW